MAFQFTQLAIRVLGPNAVRYVGYAVAPLAIVVGYVGVKLEHYFSQDRVIRDNARRETTSEVREQEMLEALKKKKGTAGPTPEITQPTR